MLVSFLPIACPSAASSDWPGQIKGKGLKFADVNLVGQWYDCSLSAAVHVQGPFIGRSPLEAVEPLLLHHCIRR